MRSAQQQDFLSITADAAMWPDASAFNPGPAHEGPIKVLLVNAHPDDESESAATVYRITHESGGIVDHVVVTNGEGGCQYAALAEAYYRLPITSESKGGKLLGRIRREELMRASRILGIRNTYFLDQTDAGVTLNPADGFEAWDISRIRLELRDLLQFGKYNVVLVLLPTADTHGHHKTVAALTLETVAELDEDDRPAVFGVQTTAAQNNDPGRFSELGGYPVTRTENPEPLWSFDRRTPLSCHRSLDYSIVVNWVIAEHKSQGFFQMEGGRRAREYFWLFEVSGAKGAARSREFIRALSGAAA